MTRAFGISCPNCQRDLRVRSEHLGRRLHCKHCSHSFRARAGSTASSEKTSPGPSPAGRTRIHVPCPGCRRTLKIHPKYVGHDVNCKHCAHLFRVGREQAPNTPRRSADRTRPVPPRKDRSERSSHAPAYRPPGPPNANAALLRTLSTLQSQIARLLEEHLHDGNGSTAHGQPQPEATRIALGALQNQLETFQQESAEIILGQPGSAEVVLSQPESAEVVLGQSATNEIVLGPNALERQLQALRDDRDRLESESRAQGERIEALERELAEARRSLETAMARSTGVDAIRRAYKKACRHWDADREAMQARQRELQALVAEAEAKLREAEGLALGERQAWEKKLADERLEVEDHCNNLRSSAEQLLQETDSLRHERDAALRSAETLKKENAALTARVASVGPQGMQSPLGSRERAIEEERDWLRAERDRLEQERDTIRDRAATLEAESAAQAERADQAGARQRESEKSHQAELAELNEALREALEQRDAASTSHHEWDEANQQMEAELERLQYGFETERREHEQALNELRECLEAERATWQGQLAGVQGEFERERNELRDEVNRLTQDVETLRQKDVIAHRRIETLTKVRDNLVARIEQLEKGTGEANSPDPDEIRQLTEKLAEAEQQQAATTRRLDSLNGLVRDLESERDRKRLERDAERQEHQRALEALKSQREADRQEYQRTLESIQSASETECEEHQQALSALRHERDAQRHEHQKAMEALRREKDTEKAAHEKALEALRRELQAATARAESARAAVSAHDAGPRSVSPVKPPEPVPQNAQDSKELECRDIVLNHWRLADSGSSESAWETARRLDQAAKSRRHTAAEVPPPVQPTPAPAPSGPDPNALRAEINRLSEETRQLYSQGQYREAMTSARRVVELSKTLLGEHHPDYAVSLNKLGTLLLHQGDLLAAERLFEQAQTICVETVGEHHPLFAVCLNNGGMLLQARGDLGGARPLYERAGALCREVLGADHPLAAVIQNNLAGLIQQQTPPGAIQTVAWAGGGA